MAESIAEIAKEYMSDKDLKTLKDKEKLDAAERLALRNLMEHKDFPTLVKILLDITNFNGNNYTDDTHLTYFLGGRSSVMAELIGTFEQIDPTYYPRTLLKITEANNNV